MKKKQLTSYRLTDEDIALFRQAMTDVTPLADLSQSIFPLIAQKPTHMAHTTIATQDVNFSDVWSSTVTAQTILSYAKPGVQQQTRRRLKQGKFPQQAILDLHGRTIAQARHEVSIFLQHAQQQHYRCVRIIHGKGQRATSEAPLMKNYVNSWLQQHPHVIAFCSAQARDGGTGAVYVLLQVS